MNARSVVLAIVIALFGLLSAEALLDVGYIGIFTSHLQSWAGMQVITDLVIACTLIVVWIHQDARARGVNPWPYIVLTLVAGSFGPLVYLLVRSLGSDRRAVAAQA
jgi:hypothetical protein